MVRHFKDNGRRIMRTVPGLLAGLALFMSLAPSALAQAPSCEAPHKSRDGFEAVVDLSDLCLHLADGRSFPIAGPARSSLTPRSTAVVLDIIPDPWWAPTEATRQAYKEKFGFENLDGE